jgi:hypothetical protein
MFIPKIDYLLFAVLVFVVHAVVSQKHVGYLVALIADGIILFPSILGIEHHLLIYGSDPGWAYSDIRGFGGALEPQAGTRAVSFDRRMARALEDEELGHRIYTWSSRSGPATPGN